MSLLRKLLKLLFRVLRWRPFRLRLATHIRLVVGKPTPQEVRHG